MVAPFDVHTDRKTIIPNLVDIDNQFAILKTIINGKDYLIRFRPYKAFSFYNHMLVYFSTHSYISNTGEIT